MRYTHEELRSLFGEVPDSRRGQGRKHRLATVLSVCALARLAGQYGPAATERFARNLDQQELRALLEDVDLRGCVVTLDPLHSTRDTERAIVETHGADYVLLIETNCPDTFAQLAAIDWDAPAVRRHGDPPAKGHGRVEAFRVVRERTEAKTGETSVETAYGITSVTAERAGPERLLAWNRGHWQVENGNH